MTSSAGESSHMNDGEQNIPFVFPKFEPMEPAPEPKHKLKRKRNSDEEDPETKEVRKIFKIKKNAIEVKKKKPNIEVKTEMEEQDMPVDEIKLGPVIQPVNSKFIVDVKDLLVTGMSHWALKLTFVQNEVEKLTKRLTYPIDHCDKFLLPSRVALFFKIFLRGIDMSRPCQVWVKPPAEKCQITLVVSASNDGNPMIGESPFLSHTGEYTWPQLNETMLENYILSFFEKFPWSTPIHYSANTMVGHD